MLTITGVSGDPNVSHSSTPATVTIQDDDTATLTMVATDKEAQEPGTTPNAGTAIYTISLSKLSDSATTVAVRPVTIATPVVNAAADDYSPTAADQCSLLPGHDSGGCAVGSAGNHRRGRREG